MSGIPEPTVALVQGWCAYMNPSLLCYDMTIGLAPGIPDISVRNWSYNPITGATMIVTLPVKSPMAWNIRLFPKPVCATSSTSRFANKSCMRTSTCSRCGGISWSTWPARSVNNRVNRTWMNWSFHEMIVSIDLSSILLSRERNVNRSIVAWGFLNALSTHLRDVWRDQYPFRLWSKNVDCSGLGGLKKDLGCEGRLRQDHPFPHHHVMFSVPKNCVDVMIGMTLVDLISFFVC